ncbi:MAG: type I-C CRISPR-associated protein Cas8c/Csd1 [Methylobacteriaceae bacterium]|nr:type I-C CRISPR-associated protein Cas8c/Csd1 [Methylobacteriaceae bacterium]
MTVAQAQVPNRSSSPTPIKDKFLGAAAATPQQVFVGLIKNMQHHTKRSRPSPAGPRRRGRRTASGSGRRA